MGDRGRRPGVPPNVCLARLRRDGPGGLQGGALALFYFSGAQVFVAKLWWAST